MGKKPSIKGFFKSILGLGKAGAEPPKDNTPLEPPIAKVPKAIPAPASAYEKTEAYKNRKKGRKEHSDSFKDLERIIDCIQQRGEATPGELARELGMSRSTLTYNLKRLLAHKPGAFRHEIKVGISLYYGLRSLLGEKRVERLGAGQNIRYRIVEAPPPGPEH